MCTSGQLVHCLAGRLTHLQQCCGSLVTAHVSAVRLDSTARWFLLQAQQKGLVQSRLDIETVTDFLKVKRVRRRRLALMLRLLVASGVYIQLYPIIL